jgi:hypothetical protein
MPAANLCINVGTMETAGKLHFKIAVKTYLFDHARLAEGLCQLGGRALDFLVGLAVSTCLLHHARSLGGP